MDFSAFLHQYGYLAMFVVLVLCGVGLPIPEELTLMTGGLAVGWGDVNFISASLVCIGGILAGDALVFALGRSYGRGFLASRAGRWVVSRKRQARVRKLFSKHHGKSVIIARFLMGVRIPVYAYAGQHGMSWIRFLVFDLVGATVYVPLFLSIGWVTARTLADPHEAEQHVRELFDTGRHWVYLVGGGCLFLFLTWWGYRISRARRSEAEPDDADDAGDDIDDLGREGSLSSSRDDTAAKPAVHSSGSPSSP